MAERELLNVVVIASLVASFFPAARTSKDMAGSRLSLLNRQSRGSGVRIARNCLWSSQEHAVKDQILCWK